MTKKVKVNICSNDYTITTHHDEEYVKKLCKVIDKTISDMISQNPSLTHFKACVLSCLSFLDSYNSAKSDNENLTKEITKYIEAERASIIELSSLKEDYIKLQNENFKLLEKIEEMKEELSKK